MVKLYKDPPPGPRRRPDGFQWGMDQELKEKGKSVKRAEEADGKQNGVEVFGEGSTLINNNSNDKDIEEPPSPPTPPSPKRPDTCLYDTSGNRETIRRKLHELGVTSSNQLIRDYATAVLIEAIGDFERAIDSELVILSPTGYFKSLLK
ncbi:hypothetical protein LCGC14_0758270 [marine sediment metagenome]|uniref:Uncharacterized protein n=1 Tax=marine sediment metagenome TaxID=412755 RepID=A0A0F9Q200_9ZZZZ